MTGRQHSHISLHYSFITTSETTPYLLRFYISNMQEKNLLKSSIRVHLLQYCISAALVNVTNMLINGFGLPVLQPCRRRQAVHLSIEEVHSITTWPQKSCFDNWLCKTLSNNLLTPINPSGTKYLKLIKLETMLSIPVDMKRELWSRRYTWLFIPCLSESTPGRQLKGVTTVFFVKCFHFFMLYPN